MTESLAYETMVFFAVNGEIAESLNLDMVF